MLLGLFCNTYSSEFIDTAQNYMVFFDTATVDVERSALVDKALYAQFVKTMPICCVDIFVYNPVTRCYFLVLRDLPPVQGIYSLPGGRLFKGESFFECARRKCLEEAQLVVEPICVLDLYNTIFPDSAWDCQTHTINAAIFALCTQEHALVDNNHGDYLWKSIDESPEHSYFKDVHQKAIAYITNSSNFKY